MKKQPETTRPVDYQFDKPAKQRLAEAADRLFRMLGIRVSLGLIAHEAGSNVDTLVKYFGRDGEVLVGRFVKSLIAESERFWSEIVADSPGDAEAQLRRWLELEQDRVGYAMHPHVLLSRTAAELYEPAKHPMLSEIEQHWQAERRRVVGLCRAAGLSDPVALADKLLLLVNGVRNERDAYGRFAPSRLLQRAGQEFMAAHGAPKSSLVEADVRVDADRG